MRAFRSTRISAFRLSAVAASGVIAMAVLSGCGDDKDSKGANPFGGKDSPSASAPSKPSDKPSESSTSTRKPTSSSGSTTDPTGTGTSSTVSRIDLKVGECVDWDDITDEPSKVPCTKPHDSEVIVVDDVTVPGSAPSEAAIKQAAETMCDAPSQEAADANPNLPIRGSWVYPTEESWEGGDRTVQCFAERDDNLPLPAGMLK
ncbi:MAG: hypothetical protein HOV68_14125 [Streptomycetaceae bacterium]|nr:hypothetical protein [Streptomycetaceae bacterium]